MESKELHILLKRDRTFIWIISAVVLAGYLFLLPSHVGIRFPEEALAAGAALAFTGSAIWSAIWWIEIESRSNPLFLKRGQGTER